MVKSRRKVFHRRKEAVTVPISVGKHSMLKIPPDRGESAMHPIKDTARSTVRIGYDGRVHKTFRGPDAAVRFANEVRVLEYLEARGCGFVPRLLESHPEELKIITTSCGARVDHLPDVRLAELFAELETFGVRHDDPFLRNVTYRAQDGRFCLIDFEFATILA